MSLSPERALVDLMADMVDRFKIFALVLGQLPLAQWMVGHSYLSTRTARYGLDSTQVPRVPVLPVMPPPLNARDSATLVLNSLLPH